jgi:hypothetical protein
MRLRDAWMASRAAAMAARPNLSMAAPTAVRGDNGKGEKEEEERSEVATDRWGRSVSGSGAGCAGRRVGWAAAGPEETGGRFGWLRPTLEGEGFSYYP